MWTSLIFPDSPAMRPSCVPCAVPLTTAGQHGWNQGRWRTHCDIQHWQWTFWKCVEILVEQKKCGIYGQICFVIFSLPHEAIIIIIVIESSSSSSSSSSFFNNNNDNNPSLHPCRYHKSTWPGSCNHLVEEIFDGTTWHDYMSWCLG